MAQRDAWEASAAGTAASLAAAAWVRGLCLRLFFAVAASGLRLAIVLRLYARTILATLAGVSG